MGTLSLRRLSPRKVGFSHARSGGDRLDRSGPLRAVRADLGAAFGLVELAGGDFRRPPGKRRHQILLGHRPPAGRPRFSSSRLLSTPTLASRRRMKFGIDRLLADPALRKPLEGKRIALLAHPASVTENLTHSIDALIALGLNVTAAFGPQ